MLRKRTRSHLKDHQMTQLTGDSVSESKFYSFLSSPMFVGFTSKALECDSAISPTSPLDFRILSSLGNPFRSPRSSNVGHRKTWFRNKVGLGIIDSPDFEAEHSGKVLRASDSKNIIFGIKTFNSQSSTETPKSLPKGVGIFPYTNTRPSNTKRNSSADEFENGDSKFELESSVKARSFSFGSERSESNLGGLSKGSSFLIYRGSVSENGSGPTAIDEVPKTCNPPDVKQKPIITSIGSSNHLIDNIPPSDIELSEDYTCVRVHGPNPRVTHIFGDCILECHSNDLTNFGKNKEDGNVVPPPGEISKSPSYPLSDFLRFCNSCNKNLDGEDIYMYRGEKAFCSLNCRLQEILIDEEMEKTNEDNCEDFAKPSNNEESSELSWFIAT